jgi:hypothetical protein
MNFEKVKKISAEVTRRTQDHINAGLPQMDPVLLRDKILTEMVIQASMEEIAEAWYKQGLDIKGGNIQKFIIEYNQNMSE